MKRYSALQPKPESRWVIWDWIAKAYVVNARGVYRRFKDYDGAMAVVRRLNRKDKAR